MVVPGSVLVPMAVVVSVAVAVVEIVEVVVVLDRLVPTALAVVMVVVGMGLVVCHGHVRFLSAPCRTAS